MFRFFLATLLFTSSLAFAAEPERAALQGTVEGRVYASPTGAFKITIPVLPELGGSITDTPNVVTFEDDFNVHVSIAAFPQDATQRWELNTRGLKDYLVYFFGGFVLADFKQSFEGVRVESAKFLPSTLDGALLAYILIPGGTMFGEKVPKIGDDGHPPIAKRGNLLFVKNGHIFVISIELAEKVIEGKSYNHTVAEEDETLRQRLFDVVNKIQFAKPAGQTTSTSAPAAPAAATAADTAKK
jgi:hypothetical protein